LKKEKKCTLKGIHIFSKIITENFPNRENTEDGKISHAHGLVDST
jgi:hypothetical protein